MPSYSVSEAKNQLSRLIDEANAGQDVSITRHGKVVARVHASRQVAAPQQKGMSKEWADRLREWRETATPLEKPAVDLVRELRDEPIASIE